jgi:hypothetical protein
MRFSKFHHPSDAIGENQIVCRNDLAVLGFRANRPKRKIVVRYDFYKLLVIVDSDAPVFLGIIQNNL